jgi:hypothetical protein
MDLADQRRWGRLAEHDDSNKPKKKEESRVTPKEEPRPLPKPDAPYTEEEGREMLLEEFPNGFEEAHDWGTIIPERRRETEGASTPECNWVAHAASLGLTVVHVENENVADSDSEASGAPPCAEVVSGAGPESDAPPADLDRWSTDDFRKHGEAVLASPEYQEWLRNAVPPPKGKEWILEEPMAPEDQGWIQEEPQAGQVRLLTDCLPYQGAVAPWGPNMIPGEVQSLAPEVGETPTPGRAQQRKEVPNDQEG